jgi:hypothetical protein
VASVANGAPSALQIPKISAERLRETRHRGRHELVGLRDTFVRRPDDPLSHLRFGRRRICDVAGTRSEATSGPLLASPIPQVFLLVTSKSLGL